MTREGKRVRRRQRRSRRSGRIFCMLFLLLLLLTLAHILSGTPKEAPEAPAESEPTVSTLLAATPPTVELPAVEPVVYHEQNPQEILAKLVWGEARGCSKTEQAAVVWCVMNRVDDGQGDIVEVATAPFQFYGYDPENPVDPEILALVRDVLTRWGMEQTCIGSVGRVLPKEYLYFTGDGTHNYFTTEWNSGQTWDWSLGSPYKEG